MRPARDIENLVRNTPVNTNTERDKVVLDDVLNKLEKSKNAQSAAMRPNIWRIIMRNRMMRYAAAAVIIIVLILGINYLDAPIDGASTVFAAAMDRVKHAHFFMYRDFRSHL